jgi:hypothetical protein
VLLGKFDVAVEDGPGDEGESPAYAVELARHLCLEVKFTTRARVLALVVDFGLGGKLKAHSKKFFGKFHDVALPKWYGIFYCGR